MKHPNDVKICIDDLEKIVFLLLARFKKNIGNEVELSKDYYWDISINEIYNPYKDPKDISLGQLTFDWEQLQKLLTSDDLIPYDLKRLAEILKWLSIENPIAF